MVLRCAWGTCNADERYPERLKGGYFVLFPKPKTSLEKCKTWIKNCGRPHEQLNLNRINKHKAVCSSHFVGGNGPTEAWPDPIPADGSPSIPARKPPSKRRNVISPCSEDPPPKQLRVQPSSVEERTSVEDPRVELISDTCGSHVDMSTQTEERWISQLDVLALSAETASLKSGLETSQEIACTLHIENENLKLENEKLKLELSENNSVISFGVEKVLKLQRKTTGLFKFYTAITYLRFCSLLAFLISSGSVIYEKGRTDLRSLSNDDGLFLTLCRFRHNFKLKDLAVRFGIAVQSASCVVNAWTERMYYKFGQLNIWPHRDVIINQMPEKFKADFPTSLVIIDGTEIRTQSPCALALQSQLYSDYKSSTTLKCLIGCDPRGSLLFVSELFTGSISDKQLTEQSGFYDLLRTLKSNGYIQDNDAVMADKGFTIHSEIKNLGLLLNLPPFASAGRQMSVADSNMTSKIAKHRVHIERLIKKVKTYAIVSDRIPTSLFHNINQIWTICCYLTLFQDVFIKDD